MGFDYRLHILAPKGQRLGSLDQGSGEMEVSQGIGPKVECLGRSNLESHAPWA